jgi:hypothetical protein
MSQENWLTTWMSWRWIMFEVRHTILKRKERSSDITGR